MHKYIYNQYITIKNIIISRHSYNGFIHVLIFITSLCLFRSPLGVTELILIHHSGYFHITKGIPIPVIINE